MTLKHTITGDAKGLNAELDQLTRKYAKLEQQLVSVQDASEKSNQAGVQQTQSHGASLESLSTSIVGTVTAYAGVEAVLGRINEELERKKQLETESISLQDRVAATQVELIRNVGAGPELEQRLAGVESIQESLRFPDRAALISATTQAVSSAGGLGIESQLGAVEVAARLAPTAPEDVAPIAGFTEQTMNALGPGTSPEEAIGFLMSAGAQAGIRSTMVQGRNIAPVVATAGEMGGGPDAARQAAALFGTLTQVGSPEESRTATIGLMRALESQFSAEGVTDPGTLMGRIQAIQQRPELFEELQGSGGNIPGVSASLQATARGLLTDPGGLRAQQFATMTQAIQVDESLFEEQATAIEGATRELRGAAAGRAQAGLHERVLGLQSQVARAAEAGETFADIDPNAWMGLLHRQVFRHAGPYYPDEQRMHAIGTYGRGVLEANLTAAREPGGPGGAAITAQERETIEIAQQQLAVMSQLLEEVRGGGVNNAAAANAQADRHSE